MSKWPDLPSYYHSPAPIFLKSYENYFDQFIGLIKKAKKSIYLQVYIYQNDSFGTKVRDELINALIKNVEVIVVIDYIGSIYLPLSFWKKCFKYNNFKLHIFNPIFKSKNFLFGRRLHQKTMIIDKKYAIVGGINIGKNFLEKSKQTWLDYAILVSGQEVYQVLKQFNRSLPKNNQIKINKDLINTHLKKESFIKVLGNDWYHRKYSINKEYLKIIKNSKKKIIFLNSYFFPGNRFLRNLFKAKKKGIEVICIFSSKSDVPFFSSAMKYLYFRLLKNDIKIYEWEHSHLHAKVCLVDNEIVNIGSFNLHYTSQFSNLETNIQVFDKNFYQTVFQSINQEVIACSKKITLENHQLKSNSIIKRIAWFFSYLLHKFLKYVSVGTNQ